MAGDRVQALIEQLRDFRTRADASRGLAGIGTQAVGPLVKALDDERFRSARWAVVNCLGEIGAREAVPAVARLLDEPDSQSVAHDALVRITGEDRGLVSAGWLRQGAPVAAPQEGPPEPADKELLDQAVKGTGGSWRAEAENRYVATMPVGAGHTREVTVTFGAHDHEGSPMVIVFCSCGEAKPERYETALRDNLRTPYGAIGLRDVGGRPHFVVFNTILRQQLSPTELRKTMTTIAERADRVGRQICE